MIPPELDADISVLRAEKLEVQVVEEGPRIYLVFPRYTLGPGYRPEVSDLMVFTTVEYPNAGFDMFWVGEDVVLSGNGGIPQSGDQIETYINRRWRRFSWHLNRSWNPGKDSLLTWMCTVDERLRRGV